MQIRNTSEARRRVGRSRLMPADVKDRANQPPPAQTLAEVKQTPNTTHMIDIFNVRELF